VRFPVQPFVLYGAAQSKIGCDCNIVRPRFTFATFDTPMTGLPPRPVRLLCELTAVLGIGALLMLGGCATPPKPPPTANEALPVALRASRDEVLQEVMTTHGDETYICRRTPIPADPLGALSAAKTTGPKSSGVRSDPTQLLWAPFGSEAILVDAGGESVGTVAPGHYFLSYDGSYVKAATSAESQVGANALTWARYTAGYDAAPRPGSGRFADISSIQRIDTSGGLPPQPGCELEGSRLLVPYAATYMFYRPKGVAPIASSTDSTGL